MAVDVVSLPEPDLAVTLPSTPREHPTTALVVIEVAVSSQRLDLVHKAPRYAADRSPGVGEPQAVDAASSDVSGAGTAPPARRAAPLWPAAGEEGRHGG